MKELTTALQMKQQDYPRMSSRRAREQFLQLKGFTEASVSHWDK